MSDTDSFIEEVTEEVRRDRLFAIFRRYGWIAALVVVAVVGLAAFNEVKKANARAAAQATGDALIASVQSSDAAERVSALAELDTASPDAQVIADMLLATHQLEVEDEAGAKATLDGVSNSDVDMPEIYRQIAAFKAVLAQGTDTPAQARRDALAALSVAGMPLALLAKEQLAMIDLEEGKVDDAVVALNAIVQDAEVTASLRRRASQLIVALGGTPAEANGAVASQ